MKKQTSAASANLDLLRSVAVLSVFISHFIASAFHDRSYGSLGRFGVILFFVHTSLVLMGSMQRLNQTITNHFSLTLAFWVRRFFRIYPLAILCVISMVLFHIPASPLGTYQWIGLKCFIFNLALMQNLTTGTDIIGVLWSLPLEVQMYILLPLAYFAIRRENRFHSAALWVLSVVLALTLPRVNWRLGVFNYAPCFTAGILAFDLSRQRNRSLRLPAWVWPLGILTLIALFGPHDNIGLPQKFYRAWTLSLALGLIYAHVNEIRAGWMQPIFHWIAEHSYGIYLSHSIVLWLVFNRMAGGGFQVWAQVIVLVIGVIGIPVILYVLIEKPLILLGGNVARRLIEQLRPKATTCSVEVVDLSVNA